jgi:hypothetical protein
MARSFVPSIVPNGPNQTVFLVINNFGNLGAMAAARTRLHDFARSGISEIRCESFYQEAHAQCRTGSTTWMDSTMTKFTLLSVAAILSTVILAFLTTLRPIAITAVDARASEAATLAHSLAEGCTAREPSQFFACNCGKPNCL